MPQDRKFEITDARRGAALTIRVVTMAPQAEIAGVLDDGVIKIRLTAPSAGDPAANVELLGFLSTIIDVPASQMEVVAGASERDKIVSIEGVTISSVEDALHRAGL
ncbi:MAG: DUF167 domain-containing protein [Anaerolineae bacterium]